MGLLNVQNVNAPLVSAPGANILIVFNSAQTVAKTMHVVASPFIKERRRDAAATLHVILAHRFAWVDNLVTKIVLRKNRCL
jgi:hypothetical protein